MPFRTAQAEWSGNLTEGKGHIKVQSGTLDAPYDFRARTADGKGTNPEELIGAAHAGCFTMQLSALLGQAGFTAERLKTVAKVHLEKQGAGFAIPLIELELEGKVPGMSSADFQKHAETAKATCPVSKALGGVGTIMLSVKAV
ncbi:MAG TPA: OsmC family protein [Phycisphaerales bacterium]|nr:OsmC family protein [Phycisphaerales bacterium]